MTAIKKIGVLTSGGDSPGMNAAIRAVVKTALHYQIEVIGIQKGYYGMIHNQMVPLGSTSVYNIIHMGGTILKSARSEEFKTKEGREKAFENLKNRNIDALIVIGGDGTFTGASLFEKEFKLPVIGLPGTIDNDLYGTDYTIGYDSAVNTVVAAVDKIRDTAHSHDRIFIVEVMGRDAGFIALRSGMASGAEKILIPEKKTYVDDLLNALKTGFNEEDNSAIVIVAEGSEFGGAMEVKKVVNEHYPDLDTRVSILGHIQRGGSPSAFDRILASGLGFQAVKGLVEGKHGVMVGSVNRNIVFTPFDKSIKHHKSFNIELKNIAEILSA
ncbi:MAG: 6-phosphofructokinase [Bacteroidetes bacterium]|nr:MAG: 6-phosphofructokinase [Bacteroidota bacterium]